jgi:hypothetical protein
MHTFVSAGFPRLRVASSLLVTLAVVRVVAACTGAPGPALLDDAATPAEPTPTNDPAIPAADAVAPSRDAAPSIDAAPSPTPRVEVTFDDGSFGPLVRSFGPADNPATADPAYTVEARGGAAHFVIPSGNVGPRLSGFLDLPPTLVPIPGEADIEFTVPAASELRSLGRAVAGGQAIAGCYVRGGLSNGAGQWQGGLFGDYWFGYVSSGGVAVSAIRQGTTNLTSEPFSANQRVTYRIEKRGLVLTLWASYDGAPLHAVGAPVTIAVKPGGSPDIAMTHVRVLDTSGGAVDVTADDFRWFF